MKDKICDKLIRTEGLRLLFPETMYTDAGDHITLSVYFPVERCELFMPSKAIFNIED